MDIDYRIYVKKYFIFMYNMYIFINTVNFIYYRSIAIIS